MDANDGPVNREDGANLFQPDEVVRPGQTFAPAPMTASNPEPEMTVAASAPEPAAASPDAAIVAQPKPETAAQIDQPYEIQGKDSISWTASEFIGHTKTAGWYMLLGLAGIIIGAVVWLLTRDMFVSSMVVAGILLLGFYAARQPREERYIIDNHGLVIGRHQYSYGDFRSFAIAAEGAFLSIQLMPLKRFAMDITIYFDPQNADQIVDLLSQYLPLEEPRTSLTDSLMRRIHF